MYVQRLRAILIEVHKAYFNIGPKYTCDMFTKSNQVYSTRNDKMLVQPKCFSFNHGIYSFGYEGARLWNSLDPHLKEVDSLSNFKASLRKLHRGGCKCNVCFLCVLQSSQIEILLHCMFTMSLHIHPIVHPHYHIVQPPFFLISVFFFILVGE